MRKATDQRDAQTISLLCTSLLLFHGGDVTCTTPILLCTTKYLCSTTKYDCSTTLYYKVLLQYYSVLQSTTLFYKVLLQYYSVLQSTTLYYKVLLQYYSVLRSATPVLLCTDSNAVRRAWCGYLPRRGVFHCWSGVSWLWVPCDLVHYLVHTPFQTSFTSPSKSMFPSSDFQANCIEYDRLVESLISMLLMCVPLCFAISIDKSQVFLIFLSMRHHGECVRSLKIELLNFASEPQNEWKCRIECWSYLARLPLPTPFCQDGGGWDWRAHEKSQDLIAVKPSQPWKNHPNMSSMCTQDGCVVLRFKMT